MLSDLEAKKISASWHGGGGSALYAFTSTGAINTARDDHYVEQEAELELRRESEGFQDGLDDYTPQNVQDLANLLEYLEVNGGSTTETPKGKRGPQPGWSQLTW